MKFWDTSAIVPLVCREEQTERMLALFSTDRNIVTSFLTPVEITSAVWRKVRETNDHEARRASEVRFRSLDHEWTVVDDVRTVITRARRVISQHGLKTSDAFQLATALLVRDISRDLPIVTLDQRLAAAAYAEGFPVLPL